MMIPRAKGTTAARVVWKVKGEPAGPVYEGQEIVRPCPTCKPQPR